MAIQSQMDPRWLLAVPAAAVLRLRRVSSKRLRASERYPDGAFEARYPLHIEECRAATPFLDVLSLEQHAEAPYLGGA